MIEDNKSLIKRCAELERLLMKSREETKYYQKIVEEVGKRHLQEIDQISRLIAKRKMAEEELKRSEEKYRTVLETNPDPVVVYDMEGRVIYFNPAFTNIFGWTLEEFFGKKMDIFIPEDTRLDTQKMIDKVIAEKSFSNFETSRYTKENNTLFVNISAATYKDENNNPIGCIVNIRNISEHKKLEAQLQQSQKMESIGTLAGGIAHDFNNIIGIILGNTELALDDVPEWNPARLNLDDIRSAGLRAKDVVRQLLSFARKTDQELKPIKVNPIISDVLKLIRPSIPSSIEIRSNIPKKSEIIFADPTQIHQVMINLCTNAAHAMEKNGGILQISLESIALDNSTVQLKDLSSSRFVKLTVNDTGHGIPPEDKNRIFDPYFTTKEVGRGSGMGLAVVHGIIMNHDGAIFVDSQVGKGTSFSIFLPIFEGEPVIEATIKKDLPTGKERILFVDDEESIVKIGYTRLERLGYKVEATTCPIEALNLFRSKPDNFDLVITDLTMPKMSGDKFVKEILNIRPDTPIILCTGFSNKINGEKAEEMGVSEYLEKPHDKHELATAIRSALDKNYLNNTSTLS